MYMIFSGHTALITGAGQGIGRACAEVFASRGAHLVLVEKNVVTLQEVAESLSDKGVSITTISIDLTNLEAVRDEINTVAGEQSIDILVNNAGFDRPGTTARIDTDDFQAVVNIHLTVPFLLIKLLLPHMTKGGWGRIINVSSVYGVSGAKGEVAYSSAKAAVIGLTKSVSKEAGKFGVTVNAVVPGLTLTPTIEQAMADKYKDKIIQETALNRAGLPREIATVIAFLASDDASFVSGAAIPVSGGWDG